MTYQELLEEFNSRRVVNVSATEDIDLLLWAMQQLIEKLRDVEHFQERQADFQQARPFGIPYWKDR